MLRIEGERQAAAMRRGFLISLTALVGVIVVMIPAWNTFRMDFVRSGFGQYLTLLFWDSKTVLVNWQDFGLSLLESLPVISTTALLAMVFVLLFTLRLVLKYGKAFFNFSSSYNH